MNKDIKVVVSIGDLCIAYSCIALITCAIGVISYKTGLMKSKIEIVNILNEHLNESRKMQ